MEDIAVPAGGNQNKAPGIIALAWIECFISLVLVALRLYTRASITRHVGLDDFFMVISLVRLSIQKLTTADAYLRSFSY